MGLADIIPGVSGGTIALITGIYERLIFAIKSIDLRFLIYFLKATGDKKYLQKAKQNFLSIDFKFLIPLAIGMVSAFITASRIIPYLLKNFPAQIYSFFFSLILISAGIVYKKIGTKNIKTLIPGLVGFTFAFLFVGFEEIVIGHSLPIIFITGFLAICAMILPGISGSFIVLFLGQYKFMLNALRLIKIYWVEVAVFLAGALISLFSFSRLLSYLLKKYHPHTLFFLTGLMAGALRLPFEKIINVPGIYTNSITIIGTIISGIIGALLLIIVETQSGEVTKTENVF